MADLGEKMCDRAATETFQSAFYCPIFLGTTCGFCPNAPLVTVVPSPVDLSNKAKHCFALLFIMLRDSE